MRISILTTDFFLSKKIYIRLFTLVRVIFFSVITNSLFSQNNNFGISFGFLKSNTRQSLEEVASNVLKIQNNSRQPQEMSVNVSIPDGWQLFSNMGKSFTLNPG